MTRKINTKIKNWLKKVNIAISHLLNISRHEWPRIIISWLIKFFLQIGLVMAGTILVALFVDQFTVAKLPLLFVIQSIAMVIGVMIFTPLAEKLSRQQFIMTGVFVALASFVALLFVHSWPVIFFGGLIFAVSVVLAQVAIIVSLFTEELFSPLESERAFPVIESSEPVGSLAAGVLILLGISFLEVHYLLLIVAIAVALIIPTLIIFLKKHEEVPVLKSKEHSEKGKSRNKLLKEGLKYVKIIPFLRFLVIIVFFQYFAANILEFQFTKAVDEHVIASNANHDAHGEGHASQLTHGLGTVHIFISLGLLLMQLLVFSKVLKNLGVAKTIALHPFFTALSYLAMIVNFTFMTAVGAKAVFEITANMLRNAHQVSFFALREKIRAQAKEFVEGVARPLGALGGTLLLLLMQQIWHHRELTLALNLTLVATGIVMLLLVSKLSKMHTLLARKNLERHGAPQEKLEAIEVLAQKGHENAAEILIKELAFRKDEPEVKISIIKTLGLLRDPSALPEILRHFDDNSREVQLAAVQSLSNFENLGANFLTQAFARYRVTRALKRLFLQTPSKKVKVAAIKSFTNIKGAEVVPFLLKTLSSEDDQIRSEGVYACGLFRDPTVSYYLEEYLNDHSPRVRSNAIIALWQFVAMRLRLLVQLTSLLESKEPDELMSGIYAVGEIGFTQEVPRLIKLLEHDNPEIRRHAALALGKVNHSASVEHIVEFIWQENHQKALHFQRQTHSLHPQIHRQVSNLVLHGAAKRVTEILRNEGTEILEEISEKTLVELLHIFAIIEADKEALQVRNELERRHKVAKKEQAAKESPKPSLSSKSLAQAIISGPSVQG